MISSMSMEKNNRRWTMRQKTPKDQKKIENERYYYRNKEELCRKRRERYHRQKLEKLNSIGAQCQNLNKKEEALSSMA